MEVAGWAREPHSRPYTNCYFTSWRSWSRGELRLACSYVNIREKSSSRFSFAFPFVVKKVIMKTTFFFSFLNHDNKIYFATFLASISEMGRLPLWCPPHYPASHQLNTEKKCFHIHHHIKLCIHGVVHSLLISLLESNPCIHEFVAGL